MARLPALLATMLLALFLVACGSGDDGPDGGGDADFVAQANAICTESAAEQLQLAARYSGQQEYAAIADYMDELAASGDRAVNDLQGLEPPGDEADAEAWDEYLDNRRAAVAAVEERATAAEGEDEQGVTDSGAALGDLLDERDALGEVLGLDACARVLPEADLAAIEEAVDAASTSGDGEAVCEQYVATAFLEREFGGDLAKCARAQQANELADSIEITAAKGVAQAGATVDVDLAGGPSDGNSATVSLVYEDGTYRIFEVTPTGGGPAG